MFITIGFFFFSGGFNTYTGVPQGSNLGPILFLYISPHIFNSRSLIKDIYYFWKRTVFILFFSFEERKHITIERKYTFSHEYLDILCRIENQ